ncbi:MAG: single-stranded DNA-binding protein [Bacteroidales bacterium]|nr:single-stranded DNA-binding protein [Bacteroidales bacterium]
MINKVILVGRVGKDPEIRHLDQNVKVATFRLATDESYKNSSGEKITNTEWHTVVLWRGLADITEKYVKKGSLLYIEGKIKTREWTDKDGNKRYNMEIVADTMQMLDKRSDQASSGAERPQDFSRSSQESQAPMQDAVPDDLPF